MKKLLLGFAAAASVAAPMITLPGDADARPRHRYAYERSDNYQARCSRSRRIHARRGTIIGAIVGGLAGNSLARGGGRTTATVVGAGVGAVAGHQIGRHNAHC
jgi:uncharacterized protein YcfJ